MKIAEQVIKNFESISSMVANKNENLNDLFYFKPVTEETIPKKSTTQSTEKLLQKQPPRGVPRKRCSEKMPQIYRRTPMP